MDSADVTLSPHDRNRRLDVPGNNFTFSDMKSPLSKALKTWSHIDSLHSLKHLLLSDDAKCYFKYTELFTISLISNCSKALVRFDH